VADYKPYWLHRTRHNVGHSTPSHNPAPRSVRAVRPAVLTELQRPNVIDLDGVSIGVTKKPSISEIADARSETITEKMHESEHLRHIRQAGSTPISLRLTRLTA
jgi:hypothetical protein